MHRLQLCKFAESDRAASNGAASTSGASLMHGLRVVVLGAGGAGRALAFGAADKGAHVIIANRCTPLCMPSGVLQLVWAMQSSAGV